MIVKEFSRNCIKCDDKFIPTGPKCYMCEACKEKSKQARVEKMRNGKSNNHKI